MTRQAGHRVPGCARALGQTERMHGRAEVAGAHAIQSFNQPGCSQHDEQLKGMSAHSSACCSPRGWPREDHQQSTREPSPVIDIRVGPPKKAHAGFGAASTVSCTSFALNLKRRHHRAYKGMAACLCLSPLSGFAKGPGNSKITKSTAKPTPRPTHPKQAALHSQLMPLRMVPVLPLPASLRTLTDTS